jgi:predicted TIM-barrel fold metal-dependent hydrolase
MAEPQFRAGLRCLRVYHLSFELWVYHPQLAEAAALARAVPEVPMILNHVGGLLGVGPYAGRRDEVYQHWKKGIEEIATCPNVVVKLGGLGMRRCGFGWDAQPAPPTSSDLAKAMAPYYEVCIERFGSSRCMFESNFPVDKASYGYGILWNAFKRMTERFSHSERDALFYKTATRVYRLKKSVADKPAA